MEEARGAADDEEEGDEDADADEDEATRRASVLPRSSNPAAHVHAVALSRSVPALPFLHTSHAVARSSAA